MFLKALKVSKLASLTSIAFQGFGMRYMDIQPTLITEILPQLQGIISLVLPLGRSDSAKVETTRNWISSMEKVFCPLLQGLPVLQHLSLESPIFYEEYHHYHYAPVHKMLESMSTKSLKTLHIDSGIFDAPKFSQFLSRHSKTLTSVCFREIAVEGSDIRAFFTSLRATRSLTSATIEGNVLAVSKGFYGWGSFQWSARRLGLTYDLPDLVIWI